MKKTYLELIELYLETGRLDLMGLSSCVQAHLGADARAVFELVEPTFLEADHRSKGNEDALIYWDAEPINFYSDLKDNIYYEFGPFRQTVLLLCAALNGELNEQQVLVEEKVAA